MLPWWLLISPAQVCTGLVQAGFRSRVSGAEDWGFFLDLWIGAPSQPTSVGPLPLPVCSYRNSRVDSISWVGRLLSSEQRRRMGGI